MITHYQGKKVLVTGGAGFIGSHVTERLVALGAHVTVLDNLSTGTLANLAAVKDDITFIEGSITDYPTCLLASQGIELVFHLAAFISVPQSMENPLACYETNIHGTSLLLEACRENKVQTFVLSSSSAVYGAFEGICSEDTPCHPTSPYGYSKRMDELLVQQYATLYGITGICLRYFNVYGARQNPHGSYAAVVAKFKHNLAHNIPITIYGNGLQTRDFIPVEAVVEANLKLACLDSAMMRGDVYNIGSGKSISLLDLIAQLQKEYPQFNAGIIFEAGRPGDIIHSAAECSKYQKAVTEIS